MSLYTPGRRRAILLLLLTSLLILTIDLRGNAIFDASRSGFNRAMRPFESAAEVVARPVRNAWRGITQYDDLEDENQRLQERLDAMQSNDILARGVIADYHALLALEDLESPGSYERVTAYVVGQSPSNFDQTIEINKGRNDGIRVGMPVTAARGLVGKVIEVFPDRAVVRLMTDTNFTVGAKIVRPAELPTTTSTTTTTIAAPPASTVAGASSTTTTTTTTTTTSTTTTVAGATTPPTPPTTLSDPQRETGELVGRGPGNQPEVDLLDDTPAFGTPTVGDLVATSGGDLSLAPADIPIGVVTEARMGSPSQGWIVAVEPWVNLDDLQFVQVILYTTDREANSGSSPSD